MSRIYLVLQRLGDILTVLPMLYDDNQSGNRSTIMVHRKYADVLDGVGYCDQLIWNGDVGDLNGAIKLAESKSKDVRVCQVVADDVMAKKIYQRAGGPENAVTDSFVKEMFRLAGRIKDFQRALPLVFDQRNPAREEALLRSLNPEKKLKDRRYILVAAGGETSPFPYKELLMELVYGRFYQSRKPLKPSVVDLSKVKAEKFYDLLALYEKAFCLIACDSAPLHLANACPTLPVLALINDSPSLWHGSAWRKQFVSTIRYKDFPRRCIQLLNTIESIQSPGSPFVQGVKGQKLVHVYSAYALNGEHEEAKKTWEREYLTGRWIATPVELGAIGRDSKSVLKDEMRFPYLKDVIRLAALRAKDSDMIVLTRDHTCFTMELTAKLVGDGPFFSHRVLENGDHHPAVDLFCFKKSWWTQCRDEVPDLLLGRDVFWDSVLKHIVVSHGGQELQFAVYRNKE